MAHEITNTDAFGEVRANGRRAWHGLGLEIDEGLTVEEAFQEIGLGWATELVPVCAKITRHNLETGEDETRYVETENQLAQIRCDTDAILGVVSNSYRPVENQDLAKFADALTGADKAVRCETAGSLRGGRRIFALCKLPNDIEVTDRDILSQYIAVTNGHAGEASFSLYPTSVRIVCANTLRFSERDLGKGISFRHTGDLDNKFKVARETLGLAVEEVKEFEAQVRALIGLGWTKAQSKAYMEDLWEGLFGSIDPGTTEAEMKIAARRIANRDKIVAKWMANLDDEKQSMPGVVGTPWAAFNAFSQWCDHDRGRFHEVTQSDARVHSNLFGVSARHKQQAFRHALSLI